MDGFDSTDARVMIVHSADDNVIGRTLVVKNNTNKAVIVTIVISENGEENTITKYVPAGEQVMAYYGNRTLKVIGTPTFEDSY